MQSLKHIPDTEILARTLELARRERAITIVVLHHLREISERRLYAARGFGSLFEYAVRELKYSESAAQRRIDTMRALANNPEIEEQIAAGVLSLSVVAQAQRFFRHEAKNGSEVDRAEVLRALQNKSSREAERELLKRSSSPETLRAERITPKTEELSELRMMVDREFLRGLEKLKGLLAHRNPNATHFEILKNAVAMSLAQLDPAREPKRKSKKESPNETRNKNKTESEELAQKVSADTEALPTSASRHIPAAAKREVWRRARGRCEFEDCDSCFALEVDHIVPIARGGTHAVENLRLLCFAHNQYEAERILGRAFMRSARAKDTGARQ